MRKPSFYCQVCRKTTRRESSKEDWSQRTSEFLQFQAISYPECGASENDLLSSCEVMSPVICCLWPVGCLIFSVPEPEATIFILKPLSSSDVPHSHIVNKHIPGLPLSRFIPVFFVALGRIILFISCHLSLHAAPLIL